MQFNPTEEQAMIRDMARSFAEAELLPRATKHDREEKIEPAVFEKMKELGLWGLTGPVEFGGAGLGNVELSLVLEEINRACASTGVTLSVHNSLVTGPLKKFGSPAQKKAWLPRLASGEIIGAYCLTEPNAGSDAAALRTNARADGDAWVLDGTKIWVTNGGIAGVYIVYARTDPKLSKAKGISAFIVPRETKGLSVGKHEKKTGIRGSSTTEIVLEGVRIPKDNLLGELNKGFMIAMDTLDGGRIGIASQAIGITQGCLDASLKYAKERRQFSRPIADFQAVQWKLADMATQLDAARMLTWRAAWLRDLGRPCAMEAAMAKLFASRLANKAADDAVQIHGSAGYSREYIVERLFRDARITEIYEGTTEAQRMVIARHLLE